MKNKISLLYFGHGLNGYYGIQRLMRGELKDKIAVKLVVVSDRNRKRAEQVKSLALDYGLRVYSGAINSADLLKEINAAKVDLGVIMNFDQKIPKKIINAIPNGIWNVHPSDLPKYRGGLPLEYMIVNGDDFRVTVHRITQNFDDGNIIYKSPLINVWDMDIDELYYFSSKQAAIALEKALILFMDGNYVERAQNNTGVSYAKPSELHGLLRINWKTDDGERIFRKILAGGLKKGAVSGIQIGGEEKLFSIADANFIVRSDSDNQPGKVSVVGDARYAVSVNGGMLCFSGTNPEIIHALNRAKSKRVILA